MSTAEDKLLPWRARFQSLESCVQLISHSLGCASASKRGGSVVVEFTSSADVCRELNHRKFFCDHRPGVGLRIAPHFYSNAEKVDLFFAELKKIKYGTGA